MQPSILISIFHKPQWNKYVLFVQVDVHHSHQPVYFSDVPLVFCDLLCYISQQCVILALSAVANLGHALFPVDVRVEL